MTMPELIDVPPGSPEWHAARRQGITATDIPAILGLSPWDSAWALYHRKLQLIPEVQQTGAMALGLILERYAGDLWCNQNPLYVAYPGGLYRSTGRPWQMATLDMRTWSHAESSEQPIELKTIVRWDGWGDSGSSDIPPHVRAQLLWQMDVMGVSRGHVGALNRVSGEFRHYTVEHELGPDCAVHGIVSDDSVCLACRDIDIMRTAGLIFRDRLLGELNPPPVDESAVTLAALKALHPGTRNDKRAEVRAVSWHNLTVWRAEAKDCDDRVRKAEAIVRDQIGEAGVITVDGEIVGYRRIQHVKEHTRKAGTRDMIVRANSKERDDE
jgi:putative phage-type endonuclease